MSPKLPSITARELISVLEKKGFIFDRQSGSHVIYLHTDGRRTTVPIHGKHDLGKGLLRQIMKDAHLTESDIH